MKEFIGHRGVPIYVLPSGRHQFQSGRGNVGSSLSWVAFSERERRRVLDVVELFGDRDTRDELGLGTVRDALADLLFPGISTIQTRARYFLFVPWIYLALESKRTSAADVADRARSAEIRLINVLADAEGENQGVIGFSSREKLQRPPSSIYWQGLREWRIRLFPGGQDAYHRLLKRGDHSSRSRRTSLEEQLADPEHAVSNWHGGLPPAPEDFPAKATFSLTADEAVYLRERVLTAKGNSLLASLLRRGKRWDPSSIEYPWAHPALGEFSEVHREQLAHAERFSLVMYGASLLYNLMLAELAPSGPRDLKEAEQTYREAFSDWSSEVKEAAVGLRHWKRSQFWNLVTSINSRIPIPTRSFVENWVGLVLATDDVSALADADRARTLIYNREISIKRGQARLANRRALEQWRGAAGAFRLNFRWYRAQRIILDVLEGLDGSKRSA